MTTVRRIIAASVAAGAIALSIGITQATAAPVAKSITVKVTATSGGGQGGWPLAK